MATDYVEFQQLETALDKLRSDLRNAYSEYEKNNQLGAAKAAGACAVFVQSLPPFECESLHVPLMTDDKHHAIEELKRGLAAATQSYTTKSERGGAIEAIEAIITFLGTLSIRPDQYRPLFALALNLKDLDKPVTRPAMFKPVKTETRPSLPSEELFFRGMVAAAVNVLLKENKLDGSCQIVARELGRRGYFCDFSQIKKWREHARSGHRQDDWDAAAYYLTCNDLDTKSLADSPITLAQKIVETAMSWRGQKPQKAPT